MLKVMAWKCEYCGKLFDYHKSCEMHEKYDCKKNVNAFNCKDCINYIKNSTQVGKGSNFGKCAKNHKVSAEQFENCPDKKFIWELSGTLPSIDEEK